MMHLRALAYLAFGTSASARVLGRYANSTASVTAACSNGTIPTPTPTGPCAAVSSVSASYLSASPSATAAVVPAGLASACLASVPIDPQLDVSLIDYLVTFAELQSTIGYLAEPPQEYLLPEIDVLGGLDEIKANLFDGYYENQFQFVSDVKKLYWRTFDGHFGFTPSLLSVFKFEPGDFLLSVSDDGLQLPSIYLGSDFNKATAQNYTPSAISTIDNANVETWTEVMSQNLRSQDPDSLYNQLFWTIAGVTSSSGNAFTQGLPFLSLPDSFTVGFANGSTSSITNRAVVNADLKGINSGELLHQVYEVAKTTTTSSSASATSSVTASSNLPVSTSSTSVSTPAPTVSRYPYPVPGAKHAYNYISGYFLNETGYSDTAVLSILAFEGSGVNINSTFDFYEFRRVLNTFFDACRAENKTRLVIDLSGNGGGLVKAGYELYKQIFPSSEIWDAYRLRATPLLAFLGNVTFPSLDGVFAAPVNETGQDFETWPDLLGPESIHDDLFTNIVRTNFSDPVGSGTTVTGYGDVPAPAQPFAAENITMVTDGVCASTCSIFAGLLARQEGVRSIAMGGRPLQKPMQAIGGVKGSLVLEYSDITAAVSSVIERNGGEIPYRLTVTPSSSPIYYSSARLNWQNAYSKEDTDTPLQFVYEAANCKRFFRLQNLVDIRTVWTDAVDVAWGEVACVKGSTVRGDSLISSDVLPYDDGVRPTAPFAAVPGSPGTEVAQSSGEGSNCTASSGVGTVGKRDHRLAPRTFKSVETDIEPVWFHVPKPRFRTS